jgi:sulfane dehydrogenase subunit SoxC
MPVSPIRIRPRTLTIHGLVDRPLVFTMDELKRFPSASHIYFLECSGNSASEWKGVSELTVQRAHGLTSCSEWTGVPLSTPCASAASNPWAWVLAEGADARRLARSIPMAKACRTARRAWAER